MPGTTDLIIVEFPNLLTRVGDESRHQFGVFRYDSVGIYPVGCEAIRTGTMETALRFACKLASQCGDRVWTAIMTGPVACAYILHECEAADAVFEPARVRDGEAVTNRVTGA